MVFSLFRKTAKADGSAADESKDKQKVGAIASPNGDLTKRNGGRRAAQEAARLTAEKIDQIESEMIADVDGRARSGPAMPPVVPSPPEDDIEVRRALAKLRKRARKASAEGKRKPTAAELLSELTLREATRTGTVASVLAADIEALDGTDTDADIVTEAGEDTGPDTDPGQLSSIDETAIVETQPEQAAGDPNDEEGHGIDVIDGTLPDALEEAAILFSNGQNIPAAGVLEQSLSENTDPAFRTMNWFMLFDLFRATGERERFEQLAVAYADDVEQSPPAWTEELLDPADRQSAKPGASPSNVDFSGTVSAKAADMVDQVIRAARHKRECSVGFSSLQAVDKDGAAHLLRLFESFEASKHPLTIIDFNALVDILAVHTEVDQEGPSESFWQLALTCFRMLDKRSEFDDLSIDYCVAFEISPPPWTDFVGTCVFQNGGGDGNELDRGRLSDQTDSQIGPGEVLVIQGDLCGKIESQRSAIKAMAQGSETVRIDCRRMRRMDFVAAGELLNEQLALQASGCRLRYEEPNYLIYALMHVMGIHETADIVRRRHH